MGTPRALRVAFVASGIAGLVYEVLWSRYLGLYVGHSAYAQVLVLSVYLGGMALGAMLVSDLSGRVARPLLWYAGAEALLAGFGLLFHPVFALVTSTSYDVLFPALGNAGLVGSARWGIAGVLILPQAMLLGATFPLMAAALVRSAPESPGRGVAVAYLLNTLGGAAGVLLAGFWMIGAFGLPGTRVAAAAVNLLAAGLAARTAAAERETRRGKAAPAAPSSAAGDDASRVSATAEPWAASPEPRRGAPLEGSAPSRSLLTLLLLVSFGTALASFAYEIGWIRMLSLALGSATHSFELMLSAFILGLAVGAWWIRDRTDRVSDPLGMLGIIQVIMGLAALLSLPVFYGSAFDVTSWLIRNLSGSDGGYELFNLGRYGLSLLVMLPATVLAGMTLPVITGTLLRTGAGEPAIGRVYAANTIGSVAGAGLAGLVLLPWLGLKGLVMAGAGLDILLGLVLLERSVRWSGGSLRRVGFGGLAAALVFGAVGFGLRFDTALLGSGVFRLGNLPTGGERIGLYYADGRTASVSTTLLPEEALIVLSTNGKPDASVGLRWLAEGRDTIPERPIEPWGDYTTQLLAPAVALAHRPGARTAANIGHGSGMSATTLLTSPVLERVVTIEIEPYMVEGSLPFLPANEASLSDPRSTFVFDDAKSYFSYGRTRYDIVFAEPSNPWVSGIASLFTLEFYEQAKGFVADGGVLAQWLQVYELTDELFLSVVAALDASFPWYRFYLVGDRDVVIVASPRGPLDAPDWSVLDSGAFRALTVGAPPFGPDHMEALFLFDHETLRPLLARGVRPNSDFRPVLDLGAERARFHQWTAWGVYGFATSSVDLPRLLAGATAPPRPYRAVPAYGLEPLVLAGRGAWLREALAAGGGSAPEHHPGWQGALLGLEQLLEIVRGDGRPAIWPAWTTLFERVEVELHRGTVGWADTTFYGEVHGFLDRVDAPREARAVVDLKEGIALLDWERTASAADLLVSRVSAGEPWMPPATLLDASVVAYLKAGRPAAARNALDMLARLSGYGADNLRLWLLDALVEEAGG